MLTAIIVIALLVALAYIVHERLDLARFNRQARGIPICAESGAPKDPRCCWNVRCQLGGTCCRADGVVGTSANQPKGGA